MTYGCVGRESLKKQHVPLRQIGQDNRRQKTDATEAPRGHPGSPIVNRGGGHRFHQDTDAYTAVNSSLAGRWAYIPRIGRDPAI